LAACIFCLCPSFGWPDLIASPSCAEDGFFGHSWVPIKQGFQKIVGFGPELVEIGQFFRLFSLIGRDKDKQKN
jgi:hypothetical protein